MSLDCGRAGPIRNLRHEMGLGRVSRELIRARGTLSQKRAAVHFNVPYTTLCALEQRKERTYHSQTLARFDAMLGQSTWELYDGPDEVGIDVPAASAAALDELREVVEQLSATVRRLADRISDPVEALTVEMTAAELDQLVAFAHFLRGRRG